MSSQVLRLLSVAALAGLLAAGASADRRRGPVQSQSASGELGTSYCTSGLNSSGQAAVITAHGSRSLADNDLRLIVTGVPMGEFFVLVHGPTKALAPFGNGFLCISGHTVIASPRINPAVTVELPVNVNEAMLMPETAHFQCWFRDHSSGPFQHDASNGVSVRFLP